MGGLCRVAREPARQGSAFTAWSDASAMAPRRPRNPVLDSGGRNGLRARANGTDARDRNTDNVVRVAGGKAVGRIRRHTRWSTTAGPRAIALRRRATPLRDPELGSTGSLIGT